MIFLKNKAQILILFSIVSLIIFAYTQKHAGSQVLKSPVQLHNTNGVKEPLIDASSEPLFLSQDMNPIRLDLSITGKRKGMSPDFDDKRIGTNIRKHDHVIIAPSHFTLVSNKKPVWKVKAIRNTRRVESAIQTQTHNRSIHTFEINSDAEYKLEMKLNKELVRNKIDSISIIVRKNVIEPPKLWGITSIIGVILGTILFGISKKT